MLLLLNHYVVKDQKFLYQSEDNAICKMAKLSGHITLEKENEWGEAGGSEEVVGGKKGA